MVEPSFFFWFFFLAREMRRQIPAVRAPTALTMRRKKRKQLPGKENVDTNSDQKVVTTTTNSDLPQLDCSICFEKITSAQGELNSCTHVFCFECIKTWAAKSNLCPLCKNRFTVINKKLMQPVTPSKRPRVEKIRVRKRDYQLSDSEEEYYSAQILAEAEEYDDEEEDQGPDQYVTDSFLVDGSDDDDDFWDADYVPRSAHFEARLSQLNRNSRSRDNLLIALEDSSESESEFEPQASNDSLPNDESDDSLLFEKMLEEAKQLSLRQSSRRSVDPIRGSGHEEENTVVIDLTADSPAPPSRTALREARRRAPATSTSREGARRTERGRRRRTRQNDTPSNGRRSTSTQTTTPSRHHHGEASEDSDDSWLARTLF